VLSLKKKFTRHIEVLGGPHVAFQFANVVAKVCKKYFVLKTRPFPLILATLRICTEKI